MDQFLGLNASIRTVSLGEKSEVDHPLPHPV